MVELENIHACGEEKNSLNTVQDSIFSHEELIELIRRTYKRLIELDNDLEKIKTRSTKFFKIVNAKSKEGTLLLKYLELAGITFSGNTMQKHIFDLVNELKKEVEEVVKDARHLR